MFALAMDDIALCRCQFGRRTAPRLNASRRNTMAITRKLLISVAAAVVAMFVIANPLGDSNHGLGKHNAFYADLGQVLFVASLIGAAVFVVLALVALIQRSRSSR
jgi:hypothetical protein